MRSVLPVGSSVHSLSASSLTRTYIVYRPAFLPAAAPLVVMLHGGFGSARQAQRSYRWNAEADDGHFVVAYPDGLYRAWNAGGGCCGRPARMQVDDVGFIAAMVAAIGRAIPLDANRVYATGMSNGGIMAYTLACRTPIFAAIGPVAATQLAGRPPPDAVSVIHIHGTADRNIPYNGGPGSGAARINGPSAPTLNARWRAANHCRPPVTSTNGVVTRAVAQSPGGRSVELVTIAGAGHQWPGAVPMPAAQRLLPLDPPSTALDATRAIWRFFAAHPR
jgi:polyhydroxybutyrate depolymerase